MSSSDSVDLFTFRKAVARPPPVLEREVESPPAEPAAERRGTRAARGKKRNQALLLTEEDEALDAGPSEVDVPGVAAAQETVPARAEEEEEDDAWLRPPPAVGGNESLTQAEQAVLRNTQRTLASLARPERESPPAQRDSRPAPAPPAAAVPPEPSFQIILRSSNTTSSTFRVRGGMRLGKVFAAFMEKHGHESCTFHFDGDRVDGNLTCDALGLSDGDVIDVKCK